MQSSLWNDLWLDSTCQIFLKVLNGLNEAKHIKLSYLSSSNFDKICTLLAQKVEWCSPISWWVPTISESSWRQIKFTWITCIYSSYFPSISIISQVLIYPPRNLKPPCITVTIFPTILSNKRFFCSEVTEFTTIVVAEETAIPLLEKPNE